MAAHGYDQKHRKEFWSKFIPKEAFKKKKKKSIWTRFLQLSYLLIT